MGYIRHKALLVNGWDADRVSKAHTVVGVIYHDTGFECLLSPVVNHAVNGGASFFICPDGSKEGWDSSDESDRLMSAAKTVLSEMDYVEWCEVLCGGDDGEFAILDHAAAEDE